jgi:hypothetical protein
MTTAPRPLRSTLAVPRLAVGVSLAAHVAAALVVSRVVWPQAPGPAAVTPFVWVVAPSTPPPPRGLERPAESLSEPPSAEAPPAAREATPPVREGSAPSDAPPREPAAEPTSPPAPIAPVRPDIDWDGERRAAIGRALERERRYRAFGADPAEAEDPDEAPRPSMFEGSGGRGGSGSSILVPGQARTRVGRWLTNLCQLTGGIGLFGLASACVAEGIDRGRYWYLRPTYLKRLPVCEDTRPGSPGSLADPSSKYSTVKCRLDEEIEP